MNTETMEDIPHCLEPINEGDEIQICRDDAIARFLFKSSASLDMSIPLCGKHAPDEERDDVEITERYGETACNIGIFGPPNAGKSTLANNICEEWTGNTLSEEDAIPYETQELKKKEDVTIEHAGEQLTLNLVDMPGVSTNIDGSSLRNFEIDEESTRNRVREAAVGISKAMEWLQYNADGIIYVLDSTKEPLRNVNVMLLGVIQSRDIPVIIVANKIDKDEAEPQRISEAFPQHTTVPVSTKEPLNLEGIYEKMIYEFGN